MAKRFTATDKWRDPWFRKLSLRAKALFLWLTDNCDNAGVIDLDLEAASFDIGETVNEKHVSEITSRLKRLPSGKLWLIKFIAFQYGTLSAKCIPHLRVTETLQTHGISYPDNDPKSTTLETTLPTTLETTIKTRTGEEKDREEGGMQGGKYHKDARTVLHFLNDTIGKHFRETDPNLTIISARLSEPEVDFEGCKTMILRQHKKWKGTEYQDYLQPSTLFRASKFDGYYAARNQPIINENNGASGSKGFDRNKGTLNAGHAERYDLKKIQEERALRDAAKPALGENA